MTKIQKIIYIIALILNISIISVELGSSFNTGSRPLPKELQDFNIGKPKPESIELPQFKFLPDLKIPGAPLKALSLIDFYLLMTMVFFGLNYVISPSLITKTQGIITISISISVILFIITNIFILIAKIMFMIGLLIAPIFGTIAYFSLYGSYNKEKVLNIIQILQPLRISMITALLYTNIKYISNLGLVFIFATTMLLTWGLSFAYSLIPGFLLSIADGILAVIVLIVALIWSIKFLISSIISLKAIITIG